MDKVPPGDYAKNPGWIDVTKLMTAAQCVFGDIQVQRVDSYKVHLSKPLPKLASTEIYEAILFYEQVEIGKWKDIFGNTELFGNSYDSDSNDFVYIYDTHRGDVRECPQGLIKIQNIGLVNNLTRSNDYFLEPCYRVPWWLYPG